MSLVVGLMMRICWTFEEKKKVSIPLNNEIIIAGYFHAASMGSASG